MRLVRKRSDGRNERRDVIVAVEGMGEGGLVCVSRGEF